MNKLMTLLSLCLLLTINGCAQEQKPEQTNYRINKSEVEWRAQLSDFEYEVLREEGTERAFSGKYVDWKDQGTFTCKACGNELFSSETKFKSGTGWPSFYAPIESDAILEKEDNKYGWNRIEIECSRCGSHLGHVFNDGPKPTGLRYCINSICLEFDHKE